MKRNWILGIVIFIVTGLVLTGIVLFLLVNPSGQGDNNHLEQLNDCDLEDQGAIIRGTVVNADTLLILESNSLSYLSTSNGVVCYVDGKLSDITEIKLGQTVEVTFSGEIAESYPSRVMGVTKICATTTEDVSVLDGTIVEVENRTIHIQDNENSENTYQLSIDEGTFVCIQGLDASPQAIKTGQNVEIAYTEGTDDELPKATILLVK